MATFTCDLRHLGFGLCENDNHIGGFLSCADAIDSNSTWLLRSIGHTSSSAQRFLLLLLISLSFFLFHERKSNVSICVGTNCNIEQCNSRADLVPVCAVIVLIFFVNAVMCDMRRRAAIGNDEQLELSRNPLPIHSTIVKEEDSVSRSVVSRVSLSMDDENGLENPLHQLGAVDEIV